VAHLYNNITIPFKAHEYLLTEWLPAPPIQFDHRQCIMCLPIVSIT